MPPRMSGINGGPIREPPVAVTALTFTPTRVAAAFQVAIAWVVAVMALAATAGQSVVD